MADSNPALEERIIELETRVAYQERLLASLDEVVREFTVRVQGLERKLRSMHALGEPDLDTGDDPPPHY